MVMTLARSMGVLLVGAACISGCDDDALAPRSVDAGAPFGLSPEQAGAVVAKVGDRTITLGDYALLLERMNNIDRARYQSKKRRRDLLQEMIDIELLAQEAKRRGLDKNPDVQDAIRQILRDAMRAKIHDTVRAPGRISKAEVKAYYDAHLEDFREPERRRVAAIVLGDPEKATEVLDKALAIENDKQWGELFFEHSLTAPKKPNANDPPDLAGSLDMVGPPGDPKGASTKVPKEVRTAVFELKALGDIHSKVIASGKRYYIVRYVGQAKAQTRRLVDAERAIRMSIFQKELKEAEDKAIAELRKELPVNVDDSVVKGIKLPAALAEDTFWGQPPPPDATAAPSASAKPGDGK